MKIIVQEAFKDLLKSTPFVDAISGAASAEADIAIGDSTYFSNLQNHRDYLYRILISADRQLTVEQMCRIEPFCVQSANDSASLIAILTEIQAKLQLTEKALLVTKEIQKKRRELEDLNEQLVTESKVQFQSLEKSNFEEMQKNLNEKSLLYFLDFISSESLNDDFVSQILKLIWKEIKKIGYSYQIGFCFENLNDSVSLITYNGIVEKSDTLKIDISTDLNSTLLATAIGRPVGKILSWKLTEFSRNGYFFVESIDQHLLGQHVQNYFRERLFTLSLYFDRWLIEKEYHLLIERWDRTFKSFSGYTHVIDEDFVIHQSNYLKSPHGEKKCYEVLASRTSPCEQCPVQTSSTAEFYIAPQKKVRVSSSEFNHSDKNYYFMFYEDLTNLDLLKSKMIQSEKMATVGRLGNHLSHELNNPLTGLKLYTQFLLSSGPEAGVTSAVKADLQEILKAAERCEKIIKNLLQFSQQSEIQLNPILFEDVLESTVTLLKSALRPHRMFIDIKPVKIMADSTALQQVIFNILKNACQAMTKAGSIKIFSIESANTVTYCIQDSGTGLSVDVKSLFTPFLTTKKVGEGTGLGLYLSKKLMERMNAEIQANMNYKSGLQIDLVFKKL